MAWHQITYRTYVWPWKRDATVFEDYALMMMMMTYVCQSQLFILTLLSTLQPVETS